MISFILHQKKKKEFGSLEMAKENKVTGDKHADKDLLVYSWNVDGLRPDVWKWMKPWLIKERPHVLCLNETKRSDAVLLSTFAEIGDQYEAILNCHKPASYHGVAVLVRKDVSFRQLPVKLSCTTRYDTTSKDPACGRVIAIELLGAFNINIVATYCPNAGVGHPPLKNLPYRIQQWDPALFAFLNEMRALKPTLWIGDINVAPMPIDVSDPKKMARWAGFTQEERDSFAKLIATGEWIDIWRQQHPKAIGYSYRGKEEKWSKSYGLRLDNCVVSDSLQSMVKDSFIVSECSAPTDHVAVGVRLCLPGGLETVVSKDT